MDDDDIECTIDNYRLKSDAFLISFAILKLADAQEKQTDAIKEATAKISAKLDKIAGMIGI